MAEKRKNKLVKDIELEREEQIGLAYYKKYGTYLSYVDLSSCWDRVASSAGGENSWAEITCCSSRITDRKSVV